MFIDGIGISGFCSFGEIQYIGPFGKINLFIGKNNSGKSNILKFLFEKYKNALTEPSITLNSLETHKGTCQEGFKVAFGLAKNGDQYKKLSSLLSKGNIQPIVLERIFSNLCRKTVEMAWIDCEFTPQRGLKQEHVDSIKKNGRSDDWKAIWSHLLQVNGGGWDHWIPQSLTHLTQNYFYPPKIDIISANRKIGKTGDGLPEDFNGNGIIERLAKLQNPTLEKKDENKLLFKNINDFLKELLFNSSAEIEIPHDRGAIYVAMDGKTLPLSSLGTGVHEVIILAVAATLLQNQVLCIEEPELHLHPLMERKLIHYLIEKTNNQYFISTHSAQILDTPEASIFHVKYENGQTIVENAYTDKEKSLICSDLGYRASDLLQTNCIIWVEGPSDRIYLNHWIKSINSDLVEGIHYSIMFYGGKLLFHLSADDPQTNDFISLRQLNRNIVILIDSDKSKENDDINQTKKRIQSEFDKGPGFAWITAGREIENYIPDEIFKNAVTSIYPDAKQNQNTTGNQYRKITSVYENINKVQVAHKVVEYIDNLNVLDLQEKLEKLVKFIRTVNGLDS